MSKPTEASAENETADNETVENEAVEDETVENDTVETEPAEAPEEIRRAIEALILVADRPVASSLMAQLTEVSVATVEQVCKELAAEYEADNRGFVLVQVAGGFRFQTHTDLAPYIERFAIEGQSARLSAAALETLAIIAYKQPLSRGQVSAIRGVNVDAVTRTLQQRGYIAEEAREDAPGQAMLFRTTDLFLERLGLDSLDDLPPLGDFAPATEVVEALESSLSAEPDVDLSVEGESAPADPDADQLDSDTTDSDTADSDTAEDLGGNAADPVDAALDAVVIDLRDAARASDQD